MKDLPEPWGTYLRLQGELAIAERVDSRSWGLEGGLNRLLLRPTVDDIDRSVNSEARKERHRSVLRRTYLRVSDRWQGPTAEASADARRKMHLIRQVVSPDLWKLLRAVGEGHDFAELGELFATRSGTLRTRVCRFREAFAELRPTV